jgi:subtilisin family serine protease
VGAVDYNNQIAYFSNLAGENKLAYVTAPGVDVLSTTPNNGYDSYSGTSMSAPHVAGVVALMLEANPNLTDAQVRQIVTSTAGKSQFIMA